jgi:DnaJ-class molecular chaperone
MILLEITAEKTQTYYDILGLKPNELQELDDKTATQKILKAARTMSKMYKKDANRGDVAAEAMLTKINEASQNIKQPEDRKKYDESLKSGDNAGLEILKIQKSAPPFFWDRNARYQAIERMMRQENLSHPLPF